MADSKGKPVGEQWAKTVDEHRTDFERAKSPVSLRVAAFALWLVAVALEVLAILVVGGRLQPPFLPDATWLYAVVAVVGCLAFTLDGQRMWKKAGAIKPVSSQALLGVVMASAGFALWALFFCASKNVPGSHKVAGLIAACLVVGASVAACTVG